MPVAPNVAYRLSVRFSKRAIISDIHGVCYPLLATYRQCDAPPSGAVAAYRHLQEVRMLLHTAKDGLLILRRIREGRAQDIEVCLRAAFPDESANIPFDVLASYFAGAQVALVQWWLEKRQPRTPEVLAQTLHRLQRAAICQAVG